MSNDVERLAKVRELVAEALYRQVHPDCGPMTGNQRGHAFQKADKLLYALEQRGLTVTLPTPPRATPLEAACRKRYPNWGALGASAKAVLGDMMVADITAAVGALRDEAIMADSQFPTPEGTEWRVVANRIRAAWLARLTEGGAA